MHHPNKRTSKRGDHDMWTARRTTGWGSQDQVSLLKHNRNWTVQQELDGAPRPQRLDKRPWALAPGTPVPGATVGRGCLKTCIISLA